MKTMALMALSTGVNHVQCVEGTKDEVTAKHVQSAKSEESKFLALCRKHELKNSSEVIRRVGSSFDNVLIDSGIDRERIEQIIKATIDPSLNICGPSSVEKNGEVYSLEKYIFRNHRQIGSWKILSLNAGDLYVDRFTELLNNKEKHGMEPGVKFTKQMVKNLYPLFGVSSHIRTGCKIAPIFNCARKLYNELAESAKTAVIEESLPIKLDLDVKKRLANHIFDTSFTYCKKLYTHLLLKKLLEKHFGTIQAPDVKKSTL
jgi:hypothetical protein